jgi:hypothetical protein
MLLIETNAQCFINIKKKNKIENIVLCSIAFVVSERTYCIFNRILTTAPWIYNLFIMANAIRNFYLFLCPDEVTG